jgi:PmbA protein
LSELLDLAQRVVERASAGEQLEAFVTHERNFKAKAYDGAIESTSSAEPRGVGARLVDRGRTGFAFTTDLSDEGLDEVVAQARANARHATEDEAAGLAESSGRVPEVEGLFDGSQARVTADDKAAFVLELERLTRVYDPRIRAVEESVYADAEVEVAIATTTGIAASFRETDAWCFSIAIAKDEGDDEVGFEFGLGRSLAALDAGEVARRAAERALGVLGATKIPSAPMPVVFEPYVAGQFLGVIGRVLTGEAVQKGRSLFAGKLGENVAGTLTLVDDGRIAGAPGSAPWDAEGVVTQRTEVITEGVLSSYLYDTMSGRREGRASTGNASRSGFKSRPGPSPTNLAFETTGVTRDELLRSAGRALLVQDFHGVHSGANPISGDFSVGVTGHLLENGEPGKPVKEVTIAAPMLDILARIAAVADDRRWLPFGGSYGGATMLVSEMTVAGLSDS